MVQVRDTCHCNKGHVVQEPADDGIQPSVVDLVDVTFLKFVVAALPADQVPEDNETKGAKGDKGGPVHYRIAEEEKLHSCDTKALASNIVLYSR